MTEFGPHNMVSKLFFKNLFSFLRYKPSKSLTSMGSILGFTRFLKIIIGKPSSVTSQVVKQVETVKSDGFWKKLWFTVLLLNA